MSIMQSLLEKLTRRSSYCLANKGNELIQRAGRRRSFITFRQQYQYCQPLTSLPLAPTPTPTQPSLLQKRQNRHYQHERASSSSSVSFSSSHRIFQKCSQQQQPHCNYFSSICSNLRGPTSEDITYFRSVLSRPGRSILTNLSSSSQTSSSQPSKQPSQQQQIDEKEYEYEEATQELSRYNQDWTKHYHGSSSLVLRPQNTSEVSSILRYCHDNYIGIVPQGGNTGLCGAATPLNDELVLSLEDMNAIYDIDAHSGILTCDAGCILQNLNEYANQRGYLFPLDIGSKGSCQIGGNVSTNAGGQYFFRFGGLHGTVMGMEVVLPDGRVMHLNMDKGDCGGTHRKDNTGYDLKHLFIGAEGTLGIVTKVAIACPALPTSKNATLLVCDSYENVLKVLQCAKEELGEILSAVELMDYNTLRLVQKHGFGDSDSSCSQLLQDLLQPSDQSESDLPSSTTQESESEHHSRHQPPLHLLVETQGSDSEHDTSKMDNFLTRLYESDTIHNGFLARDSKQMTEMWNIREACNPSVARAGCVYKFDVSIPIEEYMEVAWEVERELEMAMVNDNFKIQMNMRSPPSDLSVCVWGHIADGNAHINIVTLGQYEKDVALTELIETTVYDAVLKRNGSISAEHGLGQSKNERLSQIKEESVLDAMASVKALFDPRGIMNPCKFLPRSSRSQQHERDS